MFSAMDIAVKEGCPLVDVVQHPLLDKVKACSAEPTKAAEFFLWILHPLNDWRPSSNAVHHPYLKQTYLRMLEEFPLPDSHPWRQDLSHMSNAERTPQQPGGVALNLWVAALSL